MGYYAHLVGYGLVYIILGKTTYFKILVLIGLLFGLSRYAIAQNNVPIDSLKKVLIVAEKQDSLTQKLDSAKVNLLPDSTVNAKKDSVKTSNPISTRITYRAADSLVFDVNSKTFFLYHDTEVKYGDITLKAARTDVNWKTNMVNSNGAPDTNGKMKGLPVFMQGTDKYVAERIRYNTKTKKGLITEVVTQQGEGYLTSEKVKKLANNTAYNLRARYTTCNLEHPHFYIESRKIKAIAKDKLVTGPFNIVIEDVPTPLGFVLGIFPTPKTRSAGVIIPQYGETQARGFFLRQGGYYFPVGDYAGVKLLGDIYSKGGYGLYGLTNYKLRYKFSGNVDLRYNKNLDGQEGFQSVQEDTWFSWNHNPEATGTGRFSASVQLGSSQYNRNNSFVQNNYLATNFSSSVNYSKTIAGTPFNYSVNLRQSQNVTTKEMDLSLPTFAFNMNRQYPFKSKTAPKNNFIQQISIGYTANADNRITNRAQGAPQGVAGFINYDTYNPANDVIKPVTFSTLPSLLGKSRNGITQNIPIGTTFQMFKYFNVSPTLNYSEGWGLKKLNYSLLNNGRTVNVDTLNQFTRAFSGSMSVGVATNLYGTFFIQKGRLEAIRQTIRPNVSFSYTPDLSDPRFGMYQVLKDTLGLTHKVPLFSASNINGPGIGRSGVIGFGLVQNLEMKLKAKPDTSQKADGAKKPKFEKRSLIDNLSINSGYNIYADSFKLSQITFSLVTRLLNNKVNINLGGSIDPYLYTAPSDLNATGTRINKLAWENGKGIGQISNANLSLSTNLNPAAQKAKNTMIDKAKSLGQMAENEVAFITAHPEQYVNWNIPWNLNVMFNAIYNKQGYGPRNLTQTVNFNGEVSLSDNWKVGVSSGYDVLSKKITNTNINIYRNLHCWEMRFNWIPFGFRQSYNFDINVKASILQDLKLSKRKSFVDR